MIPFNGGDVTDWLSINAPRATRAVAVRAALRAVPTFAAQLKRFQHYNVGTAELANAVLIPTFRALAAGWFASAYPELDGPIAAKAHFVSNIAREATFYEERYDHSCRVPPYDRVIIAATLSAAQALRTLDESQSPSSAARMAIREAHSAETLMTNTLEGSTAYRAAAADTAFLANDVSGDVSGRILAVQPLWLGPWPEWNAKGWDSLKASLAADNEDWSVWIRWYEDRCSGQPGIESLELARATLADKFWNDGPRAVNGELRRLESAIGDRPQTS